MESTIILKEDIFEVKASGPASPEGLITLFDYIRNHEDWKSGGRIMIDFRKLSDFNVKIMNFKGLSSIASFIKRNKKVFGNMKVATLLRDTMDSKVVSGLLNSLHEFYGTDVEHEIFTGYDEAIKWLKSARD